MPINADKRLNLTFFNETDFFHHSVEKMPFAEFPSRKWDVFGRGNFFLRPVRWCRKKEEGPQETSHPFPSPRPSPSKHGWALKFKCPLSYLIEQLGTTADSDSPGRGLRCFLSFFRSFFCSVAVFTVYLKLSQSEWTRASALNGSPW